MTDSQSAHTLRTRVRSLMHGRRWNQSETARRLKHIRKVWDQPRLNRIVRGDQQATVNDLDDLARVFGVAPKDMVLDRQEADE